MQECDDYRQIDSHSTTGVLTLHKDGDVTIEANESYTDIFVNIKVISIHVCCFRLLRSSVFASTRLPHNYVVWWFRELTCERHDLVCPSLIY